MHPELGSRPWVAYIVPFSFPWGQAGSRRVDGICRSITASGRDVLVVAMPDGSAPGGTEPSMVYVDATTGGTVRTVCRTSHPRNRLRRQWDYHVAGAREALDIIAAVAPSPPSHVIVYGTVATPLLQVIRWGRAAGVPVLLDVVERYSPRQFTLGLLSPGYAAATLGFARVAPRVDGVIAISRHIETYFSRRGLATLRVPPTSDLSQVPVGHPSHEGTVFGYFGSPGRKDLLDVVLRAFAQVRRETDREDLRLLVAGPGTVEALKPWSEDDLRGVEALGRLPHDKVYTWLGTLDATILARPRAQYADAGYPTKVVESLSVGTPVVCNLTSDLGEVVLPGASGWVATGPSVTEIAEAMERAASAAADERARMRRTTRELAEAHFDSARYSGPLAEFLRATA